MTSLSHGEFLADLTADGWLVPTSVDGVRGLAGDFIAVADAVTTAIRREMRDAREHLRFASVMPRADLERIGYFRNFPHLLGTVHCFCGDEAAHRTLLRAQEDGGDWTAGQAASDLVLIPAACYTVYPQLARRGLVPADGHRVTVEANCFRREPSLDPARMQSFHMQECVRIGTADQALAFRDEWLERGARLLATWGLHGSVEPADDPFFGRTAVVMARSQRARELKFELRLPVSDPAAPTACMSANYHLDSFGTAFGLGLENGEPAHSACVGFGIERVVLALVRCHGTATARWPHAVRAALKLDVD